MMSGSLGANTGSTTPNSGVASQGGELFKGFSAFVGNRVCYWHALSFFRLVKHCNT
jgi:hypothetical protein